MSSTGLTDNELRLVENAMSMRYDLLRKQMGGNDKKDIDSECGYPTVVTADLCKALYDREGIAKRVVQVLPDESWKMDPEICEGEDDTETQFEKDWCALVKKHNLYHILKRADRLSGIGTYGVILLGLNDGQTLDMPVAGVEFDPLGAPTKMGSSKLLYLRTFDESQVVIAAFDTDVTSYRFGQPLAYTINFTQVDSSAQSPQPAVSQTRIHWHRIIHLADDRESSDVFGTPRMKPVYNRLYDLRKVLSSSGEMFWKGGFPGLSFEVDPNLVSSADFDKASLRTEMENYSNGLQRYLALVGVSAKSLAPQVADPTNHFTTHIKAICVSLGIPYRIFLGTEEAQLAGSQDSKAWIDRLKDRQLKYINPMIIQPFVMRCIALGCVAPLADMEEGLVINWPDLHSSTATDKAMVAKTLTDAMTSYISGGGSALMQPKDFLTYILSFTPDQADAILKAVEDYMKTTDGEHTHDDMEEGDDASEDDMEEDPTQADTKAAKTKVPAKKLSAQ